MTDPLDALALLDVPVAPRTEFSELLLRTCLDELERPRGRVVPWRSRVLLAVAAVLLLAGVATATYLALRPAGSRASGPAQLAVMLGSGPASSSARIAVVEPNGSLRVVWHCPQGGFCGDLTGMAWSPNGRLLAFTLDELGGRSGYVGLHILDLRSGRDLHIPSLPIPHLEREQPMSVLWALSAQAARRLGCRTPSQIAWSPDSTRLAYPCGVKDRRGKWHAAIRVIRADGRGQHAILTGTSASAWPAWSPDGKWIAFSTQVHPRVDLRTGTTEPHHVVRSQVWLVSVDGRRRRRVAEGSAPTWSPDGTTIAYDTPCGIGLVALSDLESTGAPSRCANEHLHGRPMWSPDGTTIAFGGRDGTYLLDADGTGVRRISRAASDGLFGTGRVAWAPLTALQQLGDRTTQAGL